MVLIGLLLVALVCLALGLVLASAAWLVGSLAATAAAAYLMWTKRNDVVAPRASTATVAEGDAGTTTIGDADSEPDTRYVHASAGDVAAGTADSEVWVVDGKPDYHAAGCRLLGQEQAEPIPFSQATEDGFTPCGVCAPVAAVVPVEPRPQLPPEPQPAESAIEAAAGEPVPVPAYQAADELSSAAPDTAGDVWVIDGKPDYHVRDCGRLLGEDSEAVPFDQAVEDGFAPCHECHPPLAADATVLLPAIADQPAGRLPPVAEPLAPPAAAETAVPAVGRAPAAVVEPAVPVASVDGGSHSDVWVVDGRPRYHRSDCMIIKGQDAEPVAFDQATGDGFMPCSLCEPDALSQ